MQAQMMQGGAGPPLPPQGGMQPQMPARTWQSPGDEHTRQQVTQQIYQIFSKRRPGSMQPWSNRLPDFIRRLEEALYRTARSKEEYMDPSTLENRLQDVARRFVGRPPGSNPQQGGAFPNVPSSGQQMHSQAGPSGNGASAGGMSGMPMHQSQLGQGFGGPGFGGGPDPNQVLRGPAAAMANAGSMSMTMDGAGSLQSQQQLGMIPTPTNYGPNISSSALMSNGAPVMIKNSNARSDTSFMPSQQQMNGNNGGNMGKLGMNGMGGPMGGGSLQPMPPQGMQPMGFNAPSGNGMVPMVPMNHGPMSQPAPMINMGNQGGPGPGPGGMVPLNNMMPPVGPSGFGNMPMPNGMPPNNNGNLLPGLSPDIPEHVRNQYVQKQQRWLLFLRHCAKCRQNEQECQLKAQCKFGKQLWQHILHCANPACEYPRCLSSKDLLKHHQKCQTSQCPICAPVKEYVKKTRMAQAQQQQQMGGGMGVVPPPPQLQPQGPPGQQQQLVPPPLMPPEMLNSQRGGYAPMGGPGTKRGHGMMSNPPPTNLLPGGPQPSGAGGALVPVADPSAASASPFFDMFPSGPEDQLPKRPRTGEDSILRKNTGTSLLEAFTAEQIRAHLHLIRQMSEAQRAQQVAPLLPTDICKVCQLTKLSFEPPVIYCSMCGLKIKRGQVYYSTPADAGNDLKGWYCHGCFQEQKGDKIMLDGAPIKKTDLLKRKNDEDIEEGWVQCDACELWVHQICGMFNKGRNNNDVHYLCPECLLEGLETGQRQRLEVRPQAMLESKDLPTCRLSTFLEQRMQRALEHERVERAKAQGRPISETLPVEPLTIRVINSITKKCEVKPKMAETYASDGYPTEFPYRQRVVLLFQNLDGVDVCLFCMYVQEYGEDCPAPNTNVVYLSYLDSIKYFRPEISNVGVLANISLRTYIYHQVLIGYLAYVKLLGFEQMYIWACPPMQGDDYILYCHPSKQKTPRSDRLRNWYLDMLRHAKQEGIVVHLSTLWDTYFEGGRDHRLERCSATHIPYLEGDYWPGEAENQLATLADGQRQATKGGTTKKGSAAERKAGGGSKGKRYGAGPATTDEQMMARLGEILGGNMREDFIVVHFKEVCTFCRSHVDGGVIYRYRTAPGMAPPKGPAERKFEGIKIEPGPNVPTAPVTSLSICEACFHDETQRQAGNGGKVRLPQGVSCLDLMAEKVEPVQKMKDPDPDMDNEFFETRQTFLSLCQGNHFQFDTLRRAKHSSMMVLYHLHNPSAPAFTTSCNLCQAEIEPGQGFRCTQCTDFDICLNCKNTTGHPHPLQAHVRKVDETRMRLTDKERRERNEQLQRTMALLVHACSCNNPQCGSNSCRKVRQLFQHAVQCQLKVTGGCQMCKKMWCLLNLHAKGCTRSDCPVPRCRELKELRRRQTARQEEQRRLAYQNMLRQQNMAQAAMG